MGLPLGFWAGTGDVWVPMSTNLDLGSPWFPVLAAFLGLEAFLGLFRTPFAAAKENCPYLRRVITSFSL